jgi:hypothetical protein
MVADAAARNSGCVQLIIYKETKESKPWVSVSISIQPSENTNTVAVHARNKQNQDKLETTTSQPSILIFHLPPAEVLLSSVARLGALELSQLTGSFQILGEYPPRVSETRLLNLFKAVGRDVNEQGESCWISEDHQATGTGCVVLGRYPNIFPEDGSEP